MVRRNLHIYEGNKNLNCKYTSTWYERATDEELSVVKNACYNVLRNIWHAKTRDTIWSCFNKKKSSVAPDRYTMETCFVPCNAKAVNDFRDRHYAAYLLNVYCRPMVKAWFQDNGYAFDDDSFALSQLLQWIWRTAIRNG